MHIDYAYAILNKSDFVDAFKSLSVVDNLIFRTHRFDLICSLVVVTGQRYVTRGQLWNNLDTGLNPSSFRPLLADRDSYL